MREKLIIFEQKRQPRTPRRKMCCCSLICHNLVIKMSNSRLFDFLIAPSSTPRAFCARQCAMAQPPAAPKDAHSSICVRWHPRSAGGWSCGRRGHGALALENADTKNSWTRRGEVFLRDATLRNFPQSNL